MLPRPTADAAAARMNAHLPDHEERAGAPDDAMVTSKVRQNCSCLEAPSYSDSKDLHASTIRHPNAALYREMHERFITLSE